MKLEEVKEDLGQGISLEMVLIPAGKFVMGSPESEEGRSPEETQHEVTLTEPYYMGKYAVTQEQWESVMGNNPSFTKGAKFPITGVSEVDCWEFIEKLHARKNGWRNRRLGGFRLPTEAEWEYACRAGTTTAYSFGDKMTPKDANYKGSNLDKSVEVGSYRPNAFGLYDMHGNVWEWCKDWSGVYPTGAVIDPKGPSTGENCILRGGSFDHDQLSARSSARNRNSNAAYNCYGFRLARTK